MDFNTFITVPKEKVYPQINFCSHDNSVVGQIWGICIIFCQYWEVLLGLHHFTPVEAALSNVS